MDESCNARLERWIYFGSPIGDFIDDILIHNVTASPSMCVKLSMFLFNSCLVEQHRQMMRNRNNEFILIFYIV